jgi:DNA-binding NarL/FixJ family response regulator
MPMRTKKETDRGQQTRLQRDKSPTAPPTKIKVLIVHNAALTRFALVRLIGTSKRFAACAETDDAPTARELFIRYRPELVVLGLTLHRGNGIQLIKDFRKLNAAAATLVLSVRHDALSMQRAFRAGARGYLMTDDRLLEVVRALEQVSAGHVYVSASLLPWLLENFATGKIPGGDSELNILSDRELEVFALVGRGFGASQLARELGVSVKTVETHEMRIKEKLRFQSTNELRQKAAHWMLESAREGLQLTENRRPGCNCLG